MNCSNKIYTQLKEVTRSSLRINLRNASKKADNGNSHMQSSHVPKNVEEFQASQKAKFSPMRSRETSSARMSSGNAQQCGKVFSSKFMSDQGSQESKNYNLPSDSHVDVYDCNNAVSLSSVVQGNVPSPYKTDGNRGTSQYNMQGGLFCQSDKYISGDLNDHHHTKVSSKGNKGSTTKFLYNSCALMCVNKSFRINTNKVTLGLVINDKLTDIFKGTQFHTSSYMSKQDFNPQITLSSKQKLKQAAKDYGSTVIVFHVTISLISLGFFYLLVSSGVDMSSLIRKLGINLSNFEIAKITTNKSISDVNDSPSSNLNQNDNPSTLNRSLDNPSSSNSNTNTIKSQTELMAMGVSTFVLAYAIHKVFAPVRIGITLFSTPIIVRYLRRIGILKTPKL